MTSLKPAVDLAPRVCVCEREREAGLVVVAMGWGRYTSGRLPDRAEVCEGDAECGSWLGDPTPALVKESWDFSLSSSKRPPSVPRLRVLHPPELPSHRLTQPCACVLGVSSDEND
ncbi:hypothetical protein AOLI_G00288780 [Acnodon oligacanthus]